MILEFRYYTFIELVEMKKLIVSSNSFLALKNTYLELINKIYNMCFSFLDTFCSKQQKTRNDHSDFYRSLSLSKCRNINFNFYH